MAKYKIIGVERSAGDFISPKTNERINYDNIMLYHSRHVQAKENLFSAGEFAGEIKIKNDVRVIEKIFGKVPTEAEIINLVGKTVDIFFDEQKKVELINVADWSALKKPQDEPYPFEYNPPAEPPKGKK